MSDAPAPAPNTGAGAPISCGQYGLHRNCRTWRSCKCECHNGKKILFKLKAIALSKVVDEPPF